MEENINANEWLAEKLRQDSSYNEGEISELMEYLEDLWAKAGIKE